MVTASHHVQGQPNQSCTARKAFTCRTTSATLGTANPCIEPSIRPVCDALNCLDGVKTLWSCQGHYRSPRPFVIFAASQNHAFKISTLLTDWYNEGQLHFWWNVTGYFCEDGSMQYTIHPNDYRLESEWRYLPLVRKHIDCELLRLAQLFEREEM